MKQITYALGVKRSAIARHRDRPHAGRTHRWHRSLLRLTVLLIGVGWGTGAPAAAGWTSYGRVVGLEADFVGRIHLELAVEHNPTDCKDKRRFYRDPITGSELMYRLLVEAALRDIPVRVYVTGLCNLDRHSEISRVGIAP